MNMKILAFSAILLFFVSCVVTTQKVPNMRPKSDYLNFTISLNGNEIELHLQNIAEESIVANPPKCFGVNVMPFLFNSDNNPVSVKFVIKAFCNAKPIVLSPNETYNEKFMYNLEQCYDLKSGEKYTLYFKYYGNVLQKNGNAERIITSDMPLRSNIVEINR